MKKIAFQLFLLLIPCMMTAQSEWEVPDTQKPSSSTSQKKAKEGKDKTQTGNSVGKLKMKIDSKYAVGTVPVVDGKVVWTKEYTCAGKSADDMFEVMLSAITALTKTKGQSEKSRIAAMNRKEHIIAGTFEEEMIFSLNSFAKDFTSFRYTLIAECRDGAASLQLCRISYEYEKGRDTEAVYPAEKWITDEEAINKKGTNLYRINGKFRKKTIDRKDEIFSFIQDQLNKGGF